jgi:hypothetical protein
VVDVKTKDVELKKLRDLEQSQTVESKDTSQYIGQNEHMAGEYLWEMPKLNEYEADVDSLSSRQIRVED